MNFLKSKLMKRILCKQGLIRLVNLKSVNVMSSRSKVLKVTQFSLSIFVSSYRCYEVSNLKTFSPSSLKSQQPINSREMLKEFKF